MPKEVLAVLDKAKKLCESRKEKNLTIGWDDYERFKQMLHATGHFGYEAVLADALGL